MTFELFTDSRESLREGVVPITVADPGFPVGGRRPHGGAPTPEAATFRKICMSKRKNLDPWGGGAPPGSATE